jgi:hypothetical protein
MSPQHIEQTGKGTKYHFGDNKYEEFEPLFKHYKLPAYSAGKFVSLSWGLAGSGTGVPFHTHGVT